MNLHDICKEYDICTPETMVELEKNGFDFSVCKFGITTALSEKIVIRTANLPKNMADGLGVVPYPMLHEILKLLPYEIDIEGNNCFLDISKTTLLYEDVYNEQNYMTVCCAENLCEAACQLWLQLKKGGFLNG